MYLNFLFNTLYFIDFTIILTIVYSDFNLVNNLLVRYKSDLAIKFVSAGLECNKLVYTYSKRISGRSVRFNDFKQVLTSLGNPFIVAR